MRVINAVPSIHSLTTLARVDLLIRTWLRADEASERAWDEATRARKEVIDALGTVGGEHDLDGWHYTVMPTVSPGLTTKTLERRPVRTGKWKRGTP